MAQHEDRNYSAFMDLDVKDYAGLWIALVEGKVVASKKTFREAYAGAKNLSPGKKPLFAKIPERKVMILYS